MKGDFTRFTHDPAKHYTRVLKQQGRVDLDADWNEAVEIFTHLERIEAIDVIGRCGVPEDGSGFKVEPNADGSVLTISPGRLYVDGILCINEEEIALTAQPDLPGYNPPLDDGIYLAYADVWERHITYVEDPDIREVALGGPDTATRTRTICQVRLFRLDEDGPLEELECVPFPATPNTGLLAAQTDPADDPDNPCMVPAGGGYRGLENRLYRVEIHDDGRDADGNVVGMPTFKWSRDNGSVILPIAENGIDGDEVTLRRLGFDEVLTVKVGDWVEILGDETELNGRPGTLGQIVPGGIDKADLEVTLSLDVSAHTGEEQLKMRRWDHHETATVALQDGALPIQGDWFELEDGVQVRFDTAASYNVGDYWLIPARTREGDILWPRVGGVAAELPRMGIFHHYCTLALVEASGGVWVDDRDCRDSFPPLTDVGRGCCCITVEAGDDVQQAVDTVIAQGGGCVSLCRGEHEIDGPLMIRNAVDVRVSGVGAATVLRLRDTDQTGQGGIVIENGQRIALENFFAVTDDLRTLITVRHDADEALNRRLALRGLTLLNTADSDRETFYTCGIRLTHADDVLIQHCRIAAEVGILTLWGNALPDLSEEETDTGGAAPDALSATFDDLDEGAELRVGESLTTAGVTFTGRPFQWSNGQMTSDGFARVEPVGQTGGSGQELMVNNINIEFALPAVYRDVRMRYGFQGGNVNVRANGALLNAESVLALDGQTVGGAQVSVTPDTDAQQGMIAVTAGTSPISAFAIGGQEFWIDTVAFRSPEQPGPQIPDFHVGPGVIDLHLRDTAIRYRDFGILATKCERWQIDTCDAQPLETQAWADVRQRLMSDPSDVFENIEVVTSAVQVYVHVLAGLEVLFAAAGTETSGHGIVAYLWRDSAVRNTILRGDFGMYAWWWIRGSADGNTITGEDAGLYAFWLDDANWTRNRVNNPTGIGLTFTGSYRARMRHNRIRSLIGFTNVPMNMALHSLNAVSRAIQRGYGGEGQVDRLLVLGLIVEETIDLLGLRSLVDAVQAVLDEVAPAQSIPISIYLGLFLQNLLSRKQTNSAAAALPVIDFQFVQNDASCEQVCFVLERYIPLGSLRISGNRLHTTTGQALRVESKPFFANAHLVIFILRAGFVLLRRQVDRALDEAGDDEDEVFVTNVLQELSYLIEAWQQGAEGFLEVDFRIEDNTIRSLRTAIESNLFELAIQNNHITMQERLLRTPPGTATGTIFGRVMDVQGNIVPAATVRVVGTQRAVTTNAAGEYRMTGLPAGSYTLRASMPGLTTAQQDVELAAGEQVEVNFTLGQIVVELTHMTTMPASGFSDVAIAENMVLSVATNPEIEQVLLALERTTVWEPVGRGMREGAHTDPQRYSAYLLGNNGPLVVADQRNAAADAVAAVRGLTSDTDLEHTSGQLNTALRGNDRTAMAVLLPRFLASLQRYVDSQGILLKGIGGRIIENQVIVPADTQADTQALGGIQVSISVVEVTIFLALGQIVLNLLGRLEDDERLGPDPLLGITDTLVDNNEIVGGVGHGVSVQGIPGLPDLILDLRIRGNQIRGMAGTGIFINEDAIVIGADIEGNHIAGCGRNAGFSRVHGGIVVRNAALFRIRGNHVARCGMGQERFDTFGVSLDALYGLQFNDNEVLSNGSEEVSADDGGVQLTDVYGSVMLHDNVVAFNRGNGVLWANSARADEAALLPPLLLVAVNLYLRTVTQTGERVGEEQASLQGNTLKTPAGSNFPAFQLLNLNEVSVTGNTCHSVGATVPLGEIQQTTRAVVANNLLQATGDIAISIKKLTEGIVFGNVGNRPVQIQASGAGVRRDFNVPPAV